MTLTVPNSGVYNARRGLLNFEKHMAQKYGTRQFTSKYLIIERDTHDVLRHRLRDALHKRHNFSGYEADPSLNKLPSDENIVPVVKFPTGKPITYPTANVKFIEPDLPVVDEDPEPEDEFSAEWLMWSMRQDS